MKHNKEALDTAPSETDEVVAEAVVPEEDAKKVEKAEEQFLNLCL